LAQQRYDPSSGSLPRALAKTKKKKKIEAPPQPTGPYNPDAVSVGVKKAKK
jgi:hypothetical protein